MNVESEDVSESMSVFDTSRKERERDAGSSKNVIDFDLFGVIKNNT